MKSLSSSCANRPTSETSWTLFLAIIACSVAIAWLREPYPLSAVHWDSSIYLFEGKQFSQGNYLQALQERAASTHAELLRGQFAWDYWPFMRLGHIALVGTVVHIFGANASTIAIVAGLYRLLFAIGLFSTAMFAVALVRVIAPTTLSTHVRIGACISLVLYLMSDIATYMSGNLVSEVPAILLLSLSAWTLVIAIEKRSPVHAAVSGSLAFLLYVVRIESIWLFLSLLASLALYTLTLETGRRSWSVLVTATAVPAMLFLAYSWFLYPLTDPRLIGAFAEIGKAQFWGTTEFVYGTSVIAANGALWAGALAALPLFTSNHVARLGVIWLGLAMVPVALAANSQMHAQARMFTLLLPPVFLLSMTSWAYVLMGISKGKRKVKFFGLIGLSVAVILISQQFSYSYLRSIPGMWRLRFVRDYVAVYPYERVDFRVPELVSIGKIIDRFQPPITLIASKGMQWADRIQILQFLEHSDTSPPSLARFTGNNDSPGRNGRRIDVRLAGNVGDDVKGAAALAGGGTVMLVATSAEGDWLYQFAQIGDLKDLFVTEHFRLTKLVTVAQQN